MRAYITAYVAQQTDDEEMKLCDADDDFEAVFFRRCAGGCGATVKYKLVAEHPAAMPELTVASGSGIAYRGGHLCSSCDMKIGDALRGK